MGITLSSQSISFLISCVVGIGLGVLYDIFRISRIAVHTPTAVILFEDVLYFFICAIITFLYMLTVIEGQVRFFILIGELIGASVYYFTVGRLVMALSQAIIGVIKKLIWGILRIVFTPLIKFMMLISTAFKINSKKIHQKVQKYGSRTKFRLKRQRILLYNFIKAGSHKNKGTGNSGSEGKFRGKKKD